MFPAATTVTAARNVARRWVLVIFVFVFKFYVVSWSVKLNRDRGSTAHYGLSWMIVRFFTACHVLLGPLAFSYVPTKFCYVYIVLSRSSTVKLGRLIVFEPVCAHGMKMSPTKLLQLFDQKTSLMSMKKPVSYLSHC